MKMNKHNLLFLIISICMLRGDLYPCTTFCIKDNQQIIFGRNLDFYLSVGYVMINKKNVTKNAYIDSPEKPITWTSKYGSITFNQFGKEFPYGGMNEAGLVVEQMWLDETQYPDLDDRYGLTELQWIQYQLDNFSRIEQVIASDSQLRILSIKNPPPGSLLWHYLVCDKTGNCASIEFINGKLVYHTKETMPVKVLTNSTYKESMAFLHEDQKGNLPIDQGNFSLFR